MKKVSLLFFLSLFIAANVNAEYKINLNNILNKDQKSETKNDATLSIGGGFHFFLSNTIEDEQYRESDVHNMMQNEGYITFTHKNTIDDYISYSISSQIKKKFNNNTRLRNVFELENSQYGKIQVSNYRKLPDDLFINTGWVKNGSENAWDRGINLNLHSDRIDDNFITNEVITGYDTALDKTGVDSGSIAYYTPSSKPLVFGVSYTPKIYYGEVVNPLYNFKDVLTAGFLYHKDISEKTNLKLSLLGEYGSAIQDLERNSNKKINDLNAVHFGALLKYLDLSIAGSVGLFNDSGHINNELGDAGKAKNTYYYDLAASYEVNKKTQISLSYFHSVYAQDYLFEDEDDGVFFGQAKLSNISLALDYKLYDDLLKPYVEINKFIVDDNDAVPLDKRRESNNGWVIVLGAKSKF